MSIARQAPPALLLFVPWAGVLLALLIIGAALALATPYFLTSSNIFAVACPMFRAIWFIAHEQGTA